VVRARATEAGGSTLEVADDGPGIPASFRDKAFERFSRVEQSRTTPGSGLGLSLVRAVARLHGGEVTIGDAAPGLVLRIEVPPP
jgi:signal transduction histidine kinase